MTQSTSQEVPARVLRFGLFEVDLKTNELRKKGLRLKLQEQQFNLLAVLLERPGELVTREELRTRLWKPDTFVEFDHSLNTAMMRLREVLGDSSDNPIFIQTIPRKGYRFIAPVHEPEVERPAEEARRTVPENRVDEEPGLAAVAASLPSPTVEKAARGLPLRRAIAVGAALLVLLLIGIALLIHWRYEVSSARAKQIASIVVLPMENLSGDSNQDYFADGMTDELIANLARIGSLRVISRTTAMEYKGTHESLENIARDLNVDAVVEGTVLRSGDRVRITAEMIQVSTDRHIWAETYESTMGDVLVLQNQVTAAIVNQIQIKLSSHDKAQLASSHPVNPDALEDYMKGRYYWGGRSENSLSKAISYFEAATKKDPQYALAYAGLADCYGILGAAIVGTVPTQEVAAKAEIAAKKAVELDPSLAETQTALATVEFNYDWNWTAAEAGLRRAIELNPNYATAHQRYSLYLIAMGRTKQSLAEMNQARSLDPLSLNMSFSLGWRLYMARQYDQAIEQLRSTVELDPTYLLAHIVLAQCYEQKGEYPLAIAELKKAEFLAPDSPPVEAALGHVYAASGDRADALKLLDALKSASSKRYVSPFYVAFVYAGLGNKDQALEWLQKAYEDRSNNMIFLDVVPQFDELRSLPQFQALRRQIGL